MKDLDRDTERDRQAIKEADDLLHLNEQQHCVCVCVCVCVKEKERESQNAPSDLGSKAAGKRLKAFWVQGRDGGKEVKEGMTQRKKSQGE